MSDLIPSTVPLNQGLDLQTPKLIAEPGSLVGCLNYEVVDFSGCKRIDGYERYDGRASPSITQYYRISTTSTVSSYVFGDILVADKTVIYSSEVVAPVYFSLGGGDLLVDEDGNYIVTNSGSGSQTSTGPFGVCLGTGSSGATNYIYFAALNRKYFPAAGATVYRKNLTADTNDNAVTVTAVEVDHAFETSANVYSNILGYQEDLRGDITDLPGTPIGLHWFRDRLYAVAGLAVIKVTSIVAATGLPTTGDQGAATLPGPGTLLTSDNGETLVVYDASDLGYAPAGYDDVNVVEIIAVKTSTIQLIDEVFPGVTWAAGTVEGKVASITSDTSLATLWECKSIEQTLSEDAAPFTFGWKEVETAWQISFTNGNVAAGYFDKLERNDDSNLGNLYYFSNGGGSTFSAKIVSYFVTSGDLTLGTAAGIMQLTEVTVLTGTDVLIDTVHDMYSDAGFTTKVADVSAKMDYVTLPGILPLVTEGSRYEFISSNFYGNAEYDAFYGVNGVGRAFYYDGTIFAKIYTQASDTLDKPRHIANHLEHLALGFRLGSVLLSVVGSPWNFDGLLGANEIAVGDKVIGLSVLNGTMLAVFCEQSVWGISGSTVDNFTSQILVPNLGAIEYSIIDMGQPVFCTNWGISTLSQSEKYGDFVGARVSQKVNPWLLPRLVDWNSQAYGAAGVLCAIPIRSKNQYRLFLKDGNILTMTLNAEGPPAFTIQKYDCSITGGYITPLCYSSQVDQYGKERIHIGTWNEDDGGSNYVYEMDVGWSFDGQIIPAYFETNWLFQGGPATYATTAGLRAHGIVQGKASLTVTAGSIDTSYQDNYTSVQSVINLNRGLDRLVYQEYVPATNRTDLAKRGLGIQYKFTSSATTNEPPHVVQVMTVHTRPGGQKDSH